MEKNFNNEPNKFKQWEIVRVTKDKSGVILGRTGFITSIYQFPWNGIWEYSLLIDGFDSVQEVLENHLESTGEFLSQEEIDEKLRIISRKNKFDFNEIVEIVKHKRQELIGKKGHISGMVQFYTTGEWVYGIFIFDEQCVTAGFTEDSVISTGEFMLDEETDSGISLKVTTKGKVTEVIVRDPENWQGSPLTPKDIRGFEGNEEDGEDDEDDKNDA